MKPSKKYFLFLLILIFYGCSTTKVETTQTTNNLFNLVDKKNIQSQEEKNYLNSLSLFDRIYYEVEPNIKKWVSVNNITEYEYDSQNRLILEKTPYDEIKYIYDENGNILLKNHKTGTSYTFFYDENNYEIGCSFSDGYSVSYQNDEFGNHIHSIDSNSFERFFTYDKYNRLVSVKNVGREEYFYEYPMDEWTDKDLRKNYDAKITNSQNRNETYIYIENGLERGMAMMEYVPETQRQKYVYKRENKYNERNLIIHTQDTINGETWYKYIYDSNNNVLKKIQFEQF